MSRHDRERRSLTRSDARAEAKRLARAGYRAPDYGPNQAADIWCEIIRDVSPSDFREAVTRYMLHGGVYWPVPSQLRDLAIEVQRERLMATSRANESPGDPAAPCPVCGARLRTLTDEEQGVPGASPRLGVLHDVAKHREAGAPWIGYPHLSGDGDEGPEGDTTLRRIVLDD